MKACPVWRCKPVKPQCPLPKKLFRIMGSFYFLYTPRVHLPILWDCWGRKNRVPSAAVSIRDGFGWESREQCITALFLGVRPSVSLVFRFYSGWVTWFGSLVCQHCIGKVCPAFVGKNTIVLWGLYSPFVCLCASTVSVNISRNLHTSFQH